MNVNTTLNLSNAGSFDFQVGNRLLQISRRWLELQRLRSQIRKERDQLAELPDHLLKDMGIERADALHEAQRGFDDIPVERTRH